MKKESKFEYLRVKLARARMGRERGSAGTPMDNLADILYSLLGTSEELEGQLEDLEKRVRKLEKP